MRLAQLAEGRHVQGMVQLTVPALGHPMHGASRRGELDRGRAVVGGVVIPVPEPADVTGVADQHRGDHRADPEQVGDGGSRRGDRGPYPLVRCLELGVEGADLTEQLDGQVVTDLFHGSLRSHPHQEGIDVRSIDFLGDPARSKVHQQRMEAGHDLGATPPMSLLRFASRRNTSAWPTGCTRRRPSWRNAVTATARASLGSFLFDRPDPNTRVRDANVAGTLTTRSPAATSCWDNR